MSGVRFLSEPLAADKSKSTPRFVRSFKGFQVRLVCSFKGGISPVTISVFKGGRRIIQGVLVKGKALYVTVKTNRTAAFGSYDCIAKDFKGTRVKQRITLQKAGKLSLVKKIPSLNDKGAQGYDGLPNPNPNPKYYKTSHRKPKTSYKRQSLFKLVFRRSVRKILCKPITGVSYPFSYSELTSLRS